MKRILHLVPNLHDGRLAHVLAKLAPCQLRHGWQVRVAALREGGPLAHDLRDAKIDLSILGKSRLIDVAMLLGLRRLVRDFQADTIHLWSMSALRTFALAVGGTRRRLVVSVRPMERSTGWGSWLDRKLLHGADRLVVFSSADERALRAVGLPASKIAVVPLGVDVPSEAPPPCAESEGRRILGIGPLEVRRTFTDAVWAFDVLHYIHDDLRMDLVGAGPEMARLVHFAKLIGAWPYVRFPGRQPRLKDWLTRADVVWATSRRSGGLLGILQAMAQGRPVVATRVSEFAEVIVDGESGWLFPPGDKVALCRLTRRILENPAEGARLGTAARERVRKLFSAERMLDELMQI